MKDFHLHSAFPLLVLQFHDVISEDERLNIFNHLKQKPTQKHGAIRGNGSSSHFHFDNLLGEFDLTDRLNEYLIKYNEICRASYEVKITNAWFNIQNKESSLNLHCHPGSILSGALYINIDPDSSPICFENPNTFAYFNHHPNTEGEDAGTSQFNLQYYYIKPKPGDLILFPSWLKHGSGDIINNTNDRTVISFNSYDSSYYWPVVYKYD